MDATHGGVNATKHNQGTGSATFISDQSEAIKRELSHSEVIAYLHCLSFPVTSANNFRVIHTPATPQAHFADNLGAEDESNHIEEDRKPNERLVSAALEALSLKGNSSST